MNAKEELLEHVEGMEVEFVSVAYAGGKPCVRAKGTLEEVLPILDFEYNDVSGSLLLPGYVWYKDGSWSEKVEDHGMEYWEYYCVPPRDVLDI